MFKPAVLTNIAETALGLDELGRRRTAEAARNILNQGVLHTTVDQDDKRGTRLLTEPEMAIGLLMIPLAVSLSVDARGLRDFANNLRGLRRDGISHIHHALDVFRSGTGVELVVTGRINADGRPVRHAKFVVEGEPGPQGKAKEILDSYAMTTPPPFLEVRLDTGPYLRALVHHLDN